MTQYGKWALWAAIALIAFIPLRHLYNWRTAPAAPVSQTSGAGQGSPTNYVAASNNGCDNTYHNYPLPTVAEPIPGGSCTMGLNIISGAAELIDRYGNKAGPFRRESPDIKLSGTEIEWRAAEEGTVVRARFYPRQ